MTTIREITIKTPLFRDGKRAGATCGVELAFNHVDTWVPTAKTTITVPDAKLANNILAMVQNEDLLGLEIHLIANKSDGRPPLGPKAVSFIHNSDLFCTSSKEQLEELVRDIIREARG